MKLEKELKGIQNFELKAFNAIKSILTKSKTIALGVDDNDFVLWGISNPSSKKLERVLHTSKLSGVIIDVQESSAYFNFRDCSLHRDKVMLQESKILDYATSNLLSTSGHTLEDLKSSIERNNEFVYDLVQFFNDKVRIVSMNKMRVDYDGHKDLPYFYSINVKSAKLNLYVTQHQMALVTNSGFVKIHDTTKNVGSGYVANLVGSLFGVSKIDLGKIIDNHLG